MLKEKIELLQEVRAGLDTREFSDRFGDSVNDLEVAVDNRERKEIFEALNDILETSRRLLDSRIFYEVKKMVIRISNCVKVVCRDCGEDFAYIPKKCSGCGSNKFRRYEEWRIAEYGSNRLANFVENHFSKPLDRLEEVHNALLDERGKSDNPSLEKTIEHIENALSFSRSQVDKAVRELQTAIINLRRYDKGLSPSGAVLFAQDKPQRFYEWVREVENFTREDAEEELDISKNKFFELLRKVRKKVRVETEKRGSSPALYHYRGRISGE